MCSAFHISLYLPLPNQGKNSVSVKLLSVKTSEQFNVIDTAIGLGCGYIYLALCEVLSDYSQNVVNSIVISRTPQQTTGQVPKSYHLTLKPNISGTDHLSPELLTSL